MYLQSLATACPPHSFTQAECFQILRDSGAMDGLRGRSRELLQKVLTGDSGIETRRFSDPDWTENPMFSALRQLYLATTHWAEQLVEEADGVDETTRRKARFYLRQINNALSPTNFLLTNPEVLKA